MLFVISLDFWQGFYYYYFLSVQGKHQGKTCALQEEQVRMITLVLVVVDEVFLFVFILHMFCTPIRRVVLLVPLVT